MCQLSMAEICRVKSACCRCPSVGMSVYFSVVGVRQTTFAPDACSVSCTRTFLAPTTVRDIEVRLLRVSRTSFVAERAFSPRGCLCDNHILSAQTGANEGRDYGDGQRDGRDWRAGSEAGKYSYCSTSLHLNNVITTGRRQDDNHHHERIGIFFVSVGEGPVGRRKMEGVLQAAEFSFYRVWMPSLALAT